MEVMHRVVSGAGLGVPCAPCPFAPFYLVLRCVTLGTQAAWDELPLELVGSANRPVHSFFSSVFGREDQKDQGKEKEKDKKEEKEKDKKEGDKKDKKKKKREKKGEGDEDDSSSSSSSDSDSEEMP
ncbi:protein FAM133 isoform X2 [Chelonia mydas]|uniref:protein FAM133 isoform X2 n=1 Tax=Chelonia mydas TaxID=8469 RepID=UPI001CA7C499|nr:protein FAM133 isoform X2 [Chelonia mydas]